MSMFSSRLKEAIALRGVTQKWLASHSQTTEATISRYLNEKASPALLIILGNLAKALNVSSDFLIGVSNLPDSKDTITVEEKVLLNIWKNVSDYDKRVVYAVLDKYLTEQDRKALEEK